MSQKTRLHVPQPQAKLNRVMAPDRNRDFLLNYHKLGRQLNAADPVARKALKAAQKSGHSGYSRWNEYKLRQFAKTINENELAQLRKLRLTWSQVVALLSVKDSTQRECVAEHVGRHKLTSAATRQYIQLKLKTGNRRTGSGRRHRSPTTVAKGLERIIADVTAISARIARLQVHKQLADDTKVTRKVRAQLVRFATDLNALLSSTVIPSQVDCSSLPK